MPEPGRLDDLERKFEENPRRYFAPLANEYRKAGDTDRAIELCRTYLPEQPNHMSGYIVYGQALHDAGHGDEATAVFKQALTLDPENIIALRHLGDIARDSGDKRSATRWYGKVLELDPRNEEISGIITAIASPNAAAPTPERTAPPQIRPEPEFDPLAVALEDLVSQPDMPQPEMSQSELAPAVGAGAEPNAPAGAPAEAEVVTAEHEIVVDQEKARPSAEPSGEALMEQSFETSDTIESSAGRDDSSVPEPFAADEFGDDDIWGAAPATAAELESPFVTETMAELYVQQGLTSEALIIYRRLAEKRDDPRIRARIEELEQSEPAPVPEHSAGEAEAARPDSSAAASAREAESMHGEARPAQLGETVREFFARIGEQHAHSRPRIAAENETGLSALFDSATLQPDDVSAAQSLAGAFGAPQQADSSHD